MNKPNKKPKVICEKLHGFDLEDLSLYDVERLYEYMKENNIINVYLDKEFYGFDGGYDTTTMQSRLETVEQANTRYQIEINLYNKEKEKEKNKKNIQIRKLKIEAKKLGLRLIDEI